MMRRFWFRACYAACVVSLAAAAVVAVSGPARPQGVIPPGGQQIVCLKQDEVPDALKRQYGESMVGTGLSTLGARMDLYTSPEGTWTAVITTPNGVSCIAAMGGFWTTVKPEIPGVDS